MGVGDARRRLELRRASLGFAEPKVLLDRTVE